MEQQIYLIGLNYRTAGVEVRERFALTDHCSKDTWAIPLRPSGENDSAETTLDEALRNFDVKTGKTTTTAPGTQAAVTVRKVEGEGSYIDVSLPRGDRGPEGPAGRDGRDGASGVTTPANGFVTFSVEPNGDLYVETPGDDPATAWELDGDGNLYVKTGA